MMEAIGKILALVLMGAFCVSACWANWMKGKARRDCEYEAQYRRVRALLNLSDEVVVIQEPRLPELELNSRRFKGCR